MHSIPQLTGKQPDLAAVIASKQIYLPNAALYKYKYKPTPAE